MRFTRSTLAALVISTFLGGALPAAAQEERAPERHHRRGPPPAALEACKEKAEGAACGFTGQRGDVSGTCQRKEDRPLVCVPEKPRASRS